MAIDPGADGQRFGGHASGEPENFTDVVRRHIGQDAAALVAVGRGVGIFQGGKDFERSANRAAFEQLFRVLQRLVKAPLRGKHQRVRMIAIQFGRESAIGFECSGQWLLQHDAITGGDERDRVLAMVFRRCDDHGGMADGGLAIASTEGKTGMSWPVLERKRWTRSGSGSAKATS